MASVRSAGLLIGGWRVCCHCCCDDDGDDGDACDGGGEGAGERICGTFGNCCSHLEDMQS